MRSYVIKKTEILRWNEIVFRSYSYDFYHCNSYNCLETDGEPALFVSQDKAGNFIAMPLVIREIEGSDFKDCTSVYGYPGPISNKPEKEIPKGLLEFFQKELWNFFQEQRIICAFSRLHPILHQDIFFRDFGETIPLNNTVAIDLSLSLEEQWHQYRHSNKSTINKLRRIGYQVKPATSLEEIETFTEIYRETMERVHAPKHYFFDRAYFQSFLASPDFSNYLLLAYHGDEITAGAIFTTTNTIMQYHLAGTRGKYISESPMKLIIDEARLLGVQKKLQFLHIGGGVNGSDGDSLFLFKSGFSDLLFKYKTWRMIVNKQAYEELVLEKKRGSREIKANYFPFYRG